MSYKLLPPGERGPFWYARGSVAGRRFEVSTGQRNRAAAKEWAIQYVATLASAPNPSKGPVTFRAAAEAYKSFRKPAPYDATWIDRLVGYLGNEMVDEIVQARLVSAAEELLPGRANSTKNRQIFTPASAILHYAAEQEWCPYRRFKRLKVSRKSPRKPASEKAVRALLANTKGYQHAFIAVLYETGLRVTDVCALKRENLDLRAARLGVHIGKTDELASLPLSPYLIASLAKLPEVPGGWVFPWRTRWRIYDWLVPLRKKLKVAYTPHMSRHALATDAQAAGVSDKGIAELGVWRDPRSTHRYQHVRPTAVPGRSVGKLLGAKVGEKRVRRSKT